MAGAIDKYNRRAEQVNSLLCVGLDSEFDRIPEKFKAVEFPQFEFNKWIVEQTYEYAAAYKSNLAFYEARGEQGIKELKMTMDLLRLDYPDIFTICDAKKGDIANTNVQYAKAYFNWFGFDAITLHPYMGQESLAPFLEYEEKACIILCHTSNPGAGEFQELEVGFNRLWERVAKGVVYEWNTHENCMLLMGATYPEEMRKVRELAPDMTFLIAGIDTQGGKVKEVISAGLDAQKRGLIVNSSRGIIFSEDPAQAAKFLRAEINRWR